MKSLVYVHSMELGGSQLNAIEIAAELNRSGHPSMILGPDGALRDRVGELGLRFIESPDPGRRPSPRLVRVLRELCEDESIDVLHGYEWPPILEADLASRNGPRTPVVGTVMSMSVAPFIPRSVSLVVGTEQIAQHERRRGRDVHVIEPPVDLTMNYPGMGPAARKFRERYCSDRQATTVVSVGRFAHELKLEGLLSAIGAVAEIDAVHPMRLVVVGDGPARSVVEQHAAHANERAGRVVVKLTGALNDPRPAYDAADIALGMGGSALRALAFGKPLIVQGEEGFFELFGPDLLDHVRFVGWYGIGDGADTGQGKIATILRRLASDPTQWPTLGAYGREIVREIFSLTAAARTQLSIYREAINSPLTGRIRDLSLPTAQFAAYKLNRKLSAMLGTGGRDDFNAKPIARGGRRSHSRVSDKAK